MFKLIENMIQKNIVIILTIKMNNNIKQNKILYKKKKQKKLYKKFLKIMNKLFKKLKFNQEKNKIIKLMKMSFYFHVSFVVNIYILINLMLI